MDIQQLLTPVVYFTVIILLTWLVARFASIIFGRIMGRTMPLAGAQARRLGWLVVWVVGSLLAIEQLGIRTDILLLAAGLLGAGAIVALRGPLENIGAKYFSDMQMPFKVGDSIMIREYSGKVIEINSTSTIILSDDDHLVSVPNSTFLKEIVVNTTPHAWKEVAIPVAIGADVDLAAFESAVLKSLSKLRLRLDKRFPPALITKSRSPQSTDLILTVMIQRPEEREAITAEVNKRITDIVERMQTKK